MATNIISGIGKSVTSLFRDKEKSYSENKEKIGANLIDPQWPLGLDLTGKIKYLIHRYYREAAFEKIQFARKWMRNFLMFQGYHELEWSEINVAWEAIQRDTGDYAFPNNYYRANVLYGIALYMKNSPTFQWNPASDDMESQAIAQASKGALDVMKENVQYDKLRVLEALYLRLCGNSFRYSYYSLDPRFGNVTAPVFQDVDVPMDDGSYSCGNCGNQAYGNVQACQQCGNSNPALLNNSPPLTIKVPQQKGTTTYARGREMCEIVSPMEMYTRASAMDLWHTPYLIRARNVDRIVLQGSYSNVNAYRGNAGNIYGIPGDYGSNAAAEDIALIYQESLADLPGDPTQYAAWYERATSASKTTFIQGWVRPSLYYFDPELKKKFPDGIYAAVARDTLLDAKNESMDDCWVHLPYIPVPGRFWGDGDDDVIPIQLQFNETERLIIRNIAYNSVPQTFIDSTRIDKNAIINDPGEVNEVKPSGGKPIKDAIYIAEGMPLPQEVWQHRQSRIDSMAYHAGTFGSAIGEHQPGVNTMGGQQMFADRAAANESPMLMIYKECEEQWAVQMLKIAAKNWLADRIKSVEGYDGSWEFSKLRAASLDVDKVKVIARIIPINYAEQQSFAQAVAAQVLSPQDPRVQRKALELWNLPTELTDYNSHAKKQWKEIEQMKASGKQIMPIGLGVQNDAVHMDVLKNWMNSDEADKVQPQIFQLIFQHYQLHMQSMQKAMMAQAAMQGAGQEVSNHIGAASQPQQKPAGPAGAKQPTPAARQQRAMKGQIAAPNRPQPSSGNQFGRQLQ